MKIKSLSIFSIAALVALLSAFAAIPAAVSAQTGEDTDHDNGADVTNLTDIPVTGTTDDGGTFEGTFSLDEFVSGSDGELMASGTLTGEVTYDQSTADENGGMTEQITEESMMIPVSTEGLGGEGACGDLSVSLGPADIALTTPDDELPDDGTPPEDGTPEDNAPDDGATDDDGTTDDGAADDGTWNGAVPDETTPDEVTPEDDAPDDGVTDAQQAGTVLHLDAVGFDVLTDDAFGGVIGDLLCNLSGLFGDELDAGSLANLLNLFIKLS